MPRHDPSVSTGLILSRDDYQVRVSAVSYLSQFPVVVAGPAELPDQQFVIEPEPLRLPVAHMFSS
jgi:hypothetical protein